jgi:hypothetical protein
MTFSDYVEADLIDCLGYTGGDVWSSLVMEHGAKKIPPDAALIRAWGYVSRAAALGATRPDVLRAMFERTHAPVPKEQWQEAYAVGLDIGPERPQTSYAEAEATENKNFMEYLQEFRPEHYSVLKD